MSKMIKTTAIRQLALDVLCEIQSRFSPCPGYIKQMQQYSAHAQYRFLDERKPLSYDLYTLNTGKYLGTFTPMSASQLSHVFFHPPIDRQLIAPIICPYPYTDIYRLRLSLIHELVHLYSTRWDLDGRIPNSTAVLYSGFATATFVYDNPDALPCLSSSNNVSVNELFTDYLACYLSSILYPGLYSFDQLCSAHPLTMHLSAVPLEVLGNLYFENKYESLVSMLSPNAILFFQQLCNKRDNN